MVQQIYCFRGGSLYWWTDFSINHRSFVSMGYHKHLRHKLFQNNWPECLIVIKWSCIPHHDVLYGTAHEVRNLPFWDHPPHDYATNMPNFVINLSFRIFLHDFNVGFHIFLWNTFRVSCWNGFYDSYYRNQQIFSR